MLDGSDVNGTTACIDFALIGKGKLRGCLLGLRCRFVCCVATSHEGEKTEQCEKDFRHKRNMKFVVNLLTDWGIIQIDGLHFQDAASGVMRHKGYEVESLGTYHKLRILGLVTCRSGQNAVSKGES